MDINKFTAIQQGNFDLLAALFFNISEPVLKVFDCRLKRYINSLSISLVDIDNEKITLSATVVYKHIKTKYIHSIDHLIELKFSDFSSLFKNILDVYDTIAVELYYFINLLQKTKCKVHCSRCIKKECSRGLILERYVHKQKYTYVKKGKKDV
jgi:hypothetical protein